MIRPDLYAPELNPVYGAMLAHYGVVADPCRVRDPNRKGTVESAIQHTQGTALKGRRFESIEAQNAWLAHWEERWASLRIHGRKKRQVLEMYREEQPHLQPLPLEGFRIFKQATRTVDDAGLVQVEGSYYAALPAAPHSEVTVRIFDREIEILDAAGTLLRRHEKSLRKGAFVIAGSDRLFNPSRETARLLARVHKIGPHTTALAQEIFERMGRPGQRAILRTGEPSAPLRARRHRGGVRTPSPGPVRLLRRREAGARAHRGRHPHPRRRARAHAIRTGHSGHHRVPVVLGDALPGLPTGGYRWQCRSPSLNARYAVCGSRA